MTRRLSTASYATRDPQHGRFAAHLKRRSRLPFLWAIGAAIGIPALATSAHGQFIFQPLTEAESKDVKVYNHVNFLSLSSDLAVTWNVSPGEPGEPDSVTLFHSFIEFNLTSLSLTGEQIAGATLELYSPQVFDAGEVGLFLVTSPWTESGTNFLSAPTFTTLIDSVLVDQGATTYSFDVTSAVQGWTAGNFPNYGFAIRMLTQGGDVVLADADMSNGTVPVGSVEVAEYAPKLTVVPEPSTALAALCGCAMLGAMRRRSLPRRGNS